MDLVTPDVGLLFWTFISFAILIFVLKKFAWKPILDSVNDREEGIKNALDSAEKAKLEMQNLQADNQKLLKEARAERDEMMKDAREIKESMLTEAKDEAKDLLLERLKALNVVYESEREYGYQFNKIALGEDE